MTLTTSWKKNKDLLETSEIAIVGNAPSALNYKIGDLIDSFSCIVRMNNFAISKGQETFVGSKTDVFTTNFYKKDMKKDLLSLQNHKVKVIWSSVPYLNHLKNEWRNDILDGDKMFPSFNIYIPSKRDFFSANTHSRVENNLHLVLLSVLPKKLLKAYLRIAYGKGFKWPIPSTGLMAVIGATNLQPKTILLTGFNFFSSEKRYYFDKDLKSPEITHHRFGQEPIVLLNMVRNNPNIKYIFALDRKFFPEHFSNMCFIDPDVMEGDGQ